MNLYKKCTAKPYSFLAINTILASDNSSCFRKNILDNIKTNYNTDDKMKNCNTILTEKQEKYQHYLYLGKIDKYQYLASEEILPSNQSRIIEQANFTYSPLDKAFEKQIKTFEDKE